MLSARDLELVTRWERSGVPAERVLHAMELQFSKCAGQRLSLSYLAPMVEEVIKTWKKRRAGKEKPEVEERPRISVEGAFDGLIQILSSKQSPLRSKILESLQIAKRRTLNEQDFDPIEALEDLSQRVWEHALEILPEAERQAIEDEVEQALAEERKRASARSFQRTRKAWLHRRVREHYQLPELCLDAILWRE